MQLVVLNNQKIKKIYAGQYHTIILTDTGVYGVGLNKFGQLADASLVDRHDLVLSVMVQSMAIKDIFLGDMVTGFITDVDRLYCFGKMPGNHRGSSARYPVGISFQENNDFKNTVISTISAGGHHRLIMTESGDVYCWGKNSVGQCGMSMQNNSEY
jgi:alpha-tubulin suppressor-like RCC1 family protein